MLRKPYEDDMEKYGDNEQLSKLLQYNILKKIDITNSLNTSRLSKNNPYDNISMVRIKVKNFINYSTPNSQIFQIYDTYYRSNEEWHQHHFTSLYQKMVNIGMQDYLGTVLEAIKYLSTIAQMNEYEVKRFNANIAHDEQSFDKLASMLKETTKEYENFNNLTVARNIKQHKCECEFKGLQRPKKKYSTKALAIQVAHHQNETYGKNLTIYACRDDNHDITVWHLTTIRL